MNNRNFYNDIKKNTFKTLLSIKKLNNLNMPTFKIGDPTTNNWDEIFL